MVSDDSYTSFQSEDGEVKIALKPPGVKLKQGRKLYVSSSNVSGKLKPVKRESEELPRITPHGRPSFMSLPNLEPL